MKQTEQQRVTELLKPRGLRRCEPQRKRTGVRSLEIQRGKWPIYSEGLKPILGTGKVTDTSR
jgi:hypothetical protein